MDILQHLAIIPDGNRRWARKRGLFTAEGHRRGFQVLLKLIDKVKDLDIPIFTFWAFSTENWKRSKEEVTFLMSLFEQNIEKYLHKTLKNKIRFIHIGRKERLSNLLKNKIIKAEKETKEFKDHYFVLALDYGGQDEILRAIQRIQNYKLKNQNLTKEDFARFLDTKDLPYPNPDLVIRTSGEVRTSGFMIWQTAYSEWIFYPKYFPDFTPEDLEDCIKEYQKRKRRFGR